MYKLSKAAKAGTALTLAATTALGLTGCGNEPKESDATNVTTTGIYETGEMPSQNKEFIYNSNHIDMIASQDECNVRFNELLEKHFGDSEEDIKLKINLFKYQDNNIGLGIFGIKNTNALNQFLIEFLKDYNLTYLDVEPEIYVQMPRYLVDGLLQLQLTNYTENAQIIDLDGIEIKGSVSLSGVDAYNFKTNSVNVSKCQVEGFVPTNLLNNLKNMYGTEHFSFQGIDLSNITLPNNDTSIVSFYNCTGDITVNGSPDALSIYNNNPNNTIKINGKIYYLFVSAENNNVYLLESSEVYKRFEYNGEILEKENYPYLDSLSR